MATFAAGEPHRVRPRGVHAGRRRACGEFAGELAEAVPGALVEGAVAHHHVGDAARDRHRRLLDGRARRAAAVVDLAEERQLRDADLASHRDLGVGVHRERH